MKIKIFKKIDEPREIASTVEKNKKKNNAIFSNEVSKITNPRKILDEVDNKKLQKRKQILYLSPFFIATSCTILCGLLVVKNDEKRQITYKKNLEFSQKICNLQNLYKTSRRIQNDRTLIT